MEHDYEDGRFGFTSIQDGERLICFIPLTEEESNMPPEERDLSVRKRVLKGKSGA